MSSIKGSGGEPAPLSSADKKAYEQEYLHGVDLFERALDQCSKSDSMYQQEAFRDVMARALQVLNETANGLRRSDLQQQNDKIAKDFQSYSDRKDDLAQRVLLEDLEQAKKTV